MPLSGATVFSIGITIGSTEIKHFNNVQLSYSADGIGIKGVMSQQLTFDLPACEFTDITGLFPFKTKVELTVNGGDVSMSFPDFYIFSHRVKGNAVAITCYDCAMLTEEISSIEEHFEMLDAAPYDWEANYKHYYEGKTNDGQTTYKKIGGSSAPVFIGNKYFRQTNPYIGSDEKISLSRVIDDIKAVTGIASINLGDYIPAGIEKLPKDNVIGKSCRDILSGLAEAACGCFYAQSMGSTLNFAPFACEALSASFNVQKYSRVIFGLSKVCSGIIMTDGSKYYSAGSGSDVYHIIQVDTPYASSALIGAVFGSLSGKTYRAWSCQNSIMKSYPSPMAGLTFGDDTEVLVCNNLTMKITAQGCFASMGRNDVSDSEYTPEYARKLFDRVKFGEVNGCTKITKSGFVFINENASGTEEYGFKTSQGGVTDYDGAMVDSVMPTEIVSVSGTEKLLKYGGKTYRLTFDIDSSGKKTNIKFTEVTA